MTEIVTSGSMSGLEETEQMDHSARCATKDAIAQGAAGPAPPPRRRSTLHVYVLRNPRIALDEVQYASKLSNLAPDAIKLIAEHPQWGVDPSVCANLVRNPKSPVQIAIRLLDRLTPTDLRVVARGGARQPIVVAARRRLNIG